MRPLVFAVLLFLPLLGEAAEGVLYMTPEKGSYVIGEVFDVQVKADSGGAAVNAVEAELIFNPKALAVQGISTEGSILSTWSTEPQFSNDNGTIAFSGWAGHSFNGNDGLLVTVTFKALRNAIGNAHLAAGAMLAVQDGSNIITSMKSGIYTVAPREVARPVVPATTTEALPPADLISRPAPPPLITRYPQNLRAGEHIVIQGKTDPDARVIVWIQKGADEAMHDVTSNTDGEFTFTSPRGAEEGVYRLWVAVEDAYGARGPQSDRIAINVRSSSLAATVVPSTDLMSSILPYLALLIFAGLAGGYLYHRHKVAHVHHLRH